ncbi:MAG: DUF2330 domain-containing protein [Polyangiaceae bacterium]|nr:DUF2330 domain-containing protein [Polyangiaceae bacterium]
MSDITDELMLLAVSPTQSTLYDQIKYAGSPSSFAWVLPIHGTVDVGLSADVLFQSINAMTETTIQQPPSSCPPPPNCGGGSNGTGGGGLANTAAAGAALPAVTVTKQENVGPYATVQLHATDSSALSDWLTQNGFVLPDAEAPIIAWYVSQQFDFLAMKLLPNQGVQSMRPVRVTTQGMQLSLPLRMASIGTGAITGITIWVVSDGRYEPANFPFFHIDDKELVWDWSTSSSNYTTLRSNVEAESNNSAWEIESSIDLNEQAITNTITSGGVYYGNGYIGGVSPSDPSADYLPVTEADPDAGADAGDAGIVQTADQVRQADIAALFAGLSGPTVRLTRIRSDIAQAAMTSDFVLQASQDQSELSNVRNVTQSINEVCAIYNSSCEYLGQGTPAQAAAANPRSSAASSSTASASIGPTGVVGNSAAPPAADSGGCAASPAMTSPGSGAAALGGFAGVFALIWARGARERRRSRTQQKR